MRLKLTAIILLVTVFVLSSSGQEKSFPSFKARIIPNVNNLQLNFRRFTAFVLETKQLSQYVQKNGRLRLQIDKDNSWELDLEASAITTDNYTLKVETKEGQKTIKSNPNFLFKGRVNGAEQSQVRLAIREGFLYGFVEINGKEFFIEPLKHFNTSAQKDQFIIYKPDDIKREAIECGFKEQDYPAYRTEGKGAFREQGLLGTTCFEISFLAAADFSIYKKFNQDVGAVEAALLGNLNMAEGAYTKLNLGPDGSTDVGEDYLHFAMEEILVSTCEQCDIVSQSESAPDLGLEINSWLEKVYPKKPTTIFQLWTSRSLFEISGKPIAGIAFSTVSCTEPVKQIIKYHSDDAAFIRVLEAHEIGHLLGCRHDDQVKPGVTGFIMQTSVANPSFSTRFSTLADFGGGSYSAQKTIRDFIRFRNCLPSCTTNSCDGVKDLTINFTQSYDSVRITWSGVGNFIVRYKEKEALQFDPAHTQEISGNSVVLKNLQPCTIYDVEAQRKCSETQYSEKASIQFHSSLLSASSKPVNTRGDRYDLELDISCKHCQDNEYYIRLDRRTTKKIKALPNEKVKIDNLFSDGAVHKIEISKDSLGEACAYAFIYKAPYFRETSIPLLCANFDDCKLPTGWKDSLLAKSDNSAANAVRYTGAQNFFTYNTHRGNLDSSCMLYYSRHNSFGENNSGAISLTSPSLNLTNYSDLKLHFDYNFLSDKTSFNPAIASVIFQVYDGTQWVEVFKRTSDDNAPFRRNIWDSIPARVFIDLEKYKNSNFRLRLIADDGSLAHNLSNFLFVAFDNICVDGFAVSPSDRDLIVFPNPAKDELLIGETNKPNLKYEIVDMSGRIVARNNLNNYKIPVGYLSPGVYIVKIFDDHKYTTIKKFVKQ